MKTLVRSLILVVLSSSGTVAEDMPFAVSRLYKRQIHVGGILNFFRKDTDVETRWLSIKAKSGSVVVRAIALDHGQCALEPVALPATVSPDRGLEIHPNCRSGAVAVTTDGGVHRLTFHFDF